MKLKFWGVRGSIPSPGKQRCAMAATPPAWRSAPTTTISSSWMAAPASSPWRKRCSRSLPVTAHIFNTHSHWDHIQGLPFFIPVFIPGNLIKLYGAFDPITGEGPDRIMNVQMQYSYFPVREAEMKSRIEYVNLIPNETVAVGAAIIKPILLNHPVVNLGYRIDCNGKSIFFTGDHEPHFNIYEAGDDGYAEYQALIDEQRQSIVDAIRGVDVVVADSSYTQEEYQSKKGWGHGTFDSCIQLAKDAGAKILYCTHHEPTRSDDELEKVFAEALARHAGDLGGLDVRLAREGAEVVL